MFAGNYRASVSIALLSLASLSGCTGGVPKGTVTGKVTYQGKPVPEGCLITFLADVGYAALGTVDSRGNYKLVMAGEEEIPVASYHVSVTFPGIIGPDMTEEEERLFMGGDPAMVKKFGNVKQAKAPFPDKYSDPMISGLSYEIKAGPNSYDIELR